MQQAVVAGQCRGGRGTHGWHAVSADLRRLASMQGLARDYHCCQHSATHRRWFPAGTVKTHNEPPPQAVGVRAQCEQSRRRRCGARNRDPASGTHATTRVTGAAPAPAAPAPTLLPAPKSPLVPASAPGTVTETALQAGAACQRGQRVRRATAAQHASHARLTTLTTNVNADVSRVRPRPILFVNSIQTLMRGRACVRCVDAHTHTEQVQWWWRLQQLLWWSLRERRHLGTHAWQQRVCGARAAHLHPAYGVAVCLCLHEIRPLAQGDRELACRLCTWARGVGHAMSTRLVSAEQRVPRVVIALAKSTRHRTHLRLHCQAPVCFRQLVSGRCKRAACRRSVSAACVGGRQMSGGTTTQHVGAMRLCVSARCTSRHIDGAPSTAAWTHTL